MFPTAWVDTLLDAPSLAYKQTVATSPSSHNNYRLLPPSHRVQRLLATAYGRQGKDPYARLHLGEEALLQGKYDYAKQQANIALKGLPQNSASTLRAKDIIAFVDKNK